jgi:hypothetical protein
LRGIQPAPLHRPSVESDGWRGIDFEWRNPPGAQYNQVQKTDDTDTTTIK